ncbi:MAG TPA: DNA-3-methyladenine glycosylase [Methylophilaceae bacterium]|nr:DNA-3-methyladenine glycosylase [Methylophilaceae bacterium]
MMGIATETNYPYQSATDFLSQVDSDWARLIAVVGPCLLDAELEQDPYESLVRAVAYQQLHGKAAEAITRRMLALYADQFPQPAQLVATEFDQLRACGFSARKIETIQGIASAAMNGVVPIRQEAEGMSNDELITRLVSLKGIGRWTVEMLLIFTLGRLDVLPADDFGVKDGYKRLKLLDAPPTSKEITLLGQAWSPYRSIAAWYLWRVPR